MISFIALPQRLILMVALLLNLIQIASCKQANSAQKKTQAEQESSPNANKNPNDEASSIHSLVIKNKNMNDVEQSKKSQKCPVCRNRMEQGQDRCNTCNDEVANTCYRCGNYELNVNGKLCNECKKSICAICNRKKYTEDDLCSNCHNRIELQGAKDN